MMHMVVNKDVFERHIEHIKQYHTVIRLDDLINRLLYNKPLPHKPISITFDDGFKDNYLNAFPVLDKYGITASFFVLGSSISNTMPMWPHCLYTFLDSFTGRSFTIQLKDGFHFTVDNFDDKSKMIVLQKLKEFLSEKDQEERLDLLRLVCRQNKVEPEKVPLLSDYMSSSEIKELSEKGNLIGAHSMTHENLARLSLTDKMAEILRSKIATRPFYHNDFAAFAYPYGTRNCVDEETKRVLQLCGFKCAVTTFEGLNNRNTDLLEIRRIEIQEFDIVELRAHLTGIFGDVKSVIKKILGKK
jgi:peptidoglycan/xylan/chitin deacetylase (PgdA/CDA1 family)